MSLVRLIDCIKLTGKSCKPFNGEKNYVSTGAVDINTIDDSQVEIVTYDNKPSRANVVVEEGDLLFAKMQATNKVLIIVKDRANNIYSTGFYAIRPKNNVISSRCLYHLIKSKDFNQKKDRECNGATQKALNNEGLSKIQVNLPDSSIQDKIEKELDCIDSIIESNNKQLSLLDELIKARFVELFGDENNSKGWDEVEVSDVADVSVGIVIKPAQYYTSQEDGIKTFRSLNVGEMFIKDNDWVYITEIGNEKNKKSQLKENDLLVVRSGAPGMSCVITKEYEGCNAIDVIIVHPDTNKVDPYYLCAYTNYPYGKDQIEGGVGGAAQQHFNVGKYNKLKLFLPPMEEQKKFTDFLKQIDKSKFVVQQTLKETQKLFDSLMQQYFG